MAETACPFCAADVTGVAMVCAKRKVSGEGLSRAALLALVAAGFEITGCDGFGTPKYGASCYPCNDDAGFGAAVSHTGGVPSTGGGANSGGTGGTGDASPSTDAGRKD